MLTFTRAPVNSLAHAERRDRGRWRGGDPRVLEVQRVFNEPSMPMRLGFRQGEIVLIVSVALESSINVGVRFETPRPVDGDERSSE
jgi:hypothetical protein